MKKILLFSLLSFNFASSEIISLSPTTSNSSLIDIETNLLTYVNFATKWTSYLYLSEPLPKIKIERDGLVQIYAYGDYVVAQAERNQKSLPAVNAIYDRYNKTIYISDKVDLKNKSLEVTLVHEIVHYLQDINGYTDSLGDQNIACTESEAYDVQQLWQIEFNIDIELLPFVREQSLFSSMKCMGNQFN